MENKNQEIGRGLEHPLLSTVHRIADIFSDMGFSVVTGPEMETQWYNFDALNMDASHPARDMQDTFYIKGHPEMVMRTHTTNVTSRALEWAVKNEALPGAYVSVGKVFRNESTDATHEVQFYQVDGCFVGKKVAVSDLKGILQLFYRTLLNDDTLAVVLRPSYFPFVEPGFEIWLDIGGRMVEVMGAGMLHPQVLRKVGIDPLEYSGFAFGGGVDRMVMARFGIPDVRLLYTGDMRVNQWK